jgi:predicted nucleic acid-binding protein
VERNDAQLYVAALQTYCTAPYDFDVTRLAWRIQDIHGFGWWDSMLLASASIARCELFVSEDMQHGRRVGDMTIVSPFNLLSTFRLSR